MQVLENLEEASALIGERSTAVTFGVFDGVHLGHQELIKQVVAASQNFGGVSVVLTFASHPLNLLAPVYAPKMLTPRPRRLELIAELGVDVAVVVEFDREFADLEPEGFIRQVLLEKLKARAMFMGFNNRFGRGGAGDIPLIKRLAHELNFEVSVVPPAVWRDVPVSATVIRELLIEGRVRRARELLGRPHRIEGLVVEGVKRGREIGYPTANLRVPEDLLLPCSGVYAVRVLQAGKTHGGMMNIGVKPTFDPTDLTAEVHLFDFSGDLYGHLIGVDMIERMRSEKKFDSVDDLKQQLGRDKLETQVILAQES